MLLFENIFPSSVMLYFSDRSVDFSACPQGFSSQQKSCLDAAIPFKKFPIYHLNQIHGTEIADVSLNCEQNFSQADAVVTNVMFRPIAIRTADCLPVFIFDQEKKCIGLVHAGWRGTSERIVAKVVSFMQENYGSQSKDLTVVLGPAIRKCCYEVGEEFCEYFSDHIVRKEKKLYLDLCEANRDQFLEKGVGETHIFDAGVCTCCNKDFFSYRRQGAKSGRHLSVMMLRE